MSIANQAGARRIMRLDFAGRAITIVTLIGALIWAFPLYWAVVTSLKHETDVIKKGVELWPTEPTLESYVFVATGTKIGLWYINSIATALLTATGAVLIAATCGYALSQMQFPGRRLLWWLVIASFIVPIQTLIINHFVLASQLRLVNTWAGIVLPQLIAPVTIIVYKQFFDSVPRELREAAAMDGASHAHILFKLYMPMNWGVTVALFTITFIGAWNAFLWPFLITTAESSMTVAVGITQVNSAFGVQYARELATAVMAGLPVALVYIVFQRQVTNAIVLSAGIKG